MTINELKEWVTNTSYDNLSEVELISNTIEYDKKLEQYDPAIINCEAEFSEEDYLESDFLAYFDARNGSEIKKDTAIGFEYTENEETTLILFKNVSMNS